MGSLQQTRETSRKIFSYAVQAEVVQPRPCSEMSDDGKTPSGGCASKSAKKAKNKSATHGKRRKALLWAQSQLIKGERGQMWSLGKDYPRGLRCE